MIKEERKYVQSGVIAERKRVCDVCGKDIPIGTTGWAYVQEVKNQAQATRMNEKNLRDEFADICIECWKSVKANCLRKMRDDTGEEEKRAVTRSDTGSAPGDIPGDTPEEPSEARRDVSHRNRKENRRR